MRGGRRNSGSPGVPPSLDGSKSPRDYTPPWSENSTEQDLEETVEYGDAVGSYQVHEDYIEVCIDLPLELGDPLYEDVEVHDVRYDGDEEGGLTVLYDEQGNGVHLSLSVEEGRQLEMVDDRINNGVLSVYFEDTMSE